MSYEDRMRGELPLDFLMTKEYKVTYLSNKWQ